MFQVFPVGGASLVASLSWIAQRLLWHTLRGEDRLSIVAKKALSFSRKWSFKWSATYRTNLKHIARQLDFSVPVLKMKSIWIFWNLGRFSSYFSQWYLRLHFKIKTIYYRAVQTGCGWRSKFSSCKPFWRSIGITETADLWSITHSSYITSLI